MLEIKFGCPFWSQSKWASHLYLNSDKKRSALQAYNTLFNSVEGNTSFYQLPSEESLLNWKQQVDPAFSFTFKFPQEISHEGALTDNPALVNQVLQRFSLMEGQLGVVMLQLPASFGPSRLDELNVFLQNLPTEFNYAVEVRHLDLFDKGNNERKLNQVLAHHNVNRIILDSRALFACKTDLTPLIEEVQARKPKVPTNVIATAKFPLIRFIGHPTLEENERFFAPWVSKLEQWLEQGKQPYLFFHMHDQFSAPWLAEMFFQYWRRESPNLTLPQLNLPPINGQQMDIFS